LELFEVGEISVRYIITIVTNGSKRKAGWGDAKHCVKRWRVLRGVLDAERVAAAQTLERVAHLAHPAALLM
jgi:hypothetical protein